MFLLNICFVYNIIVYVIEQKAGCDFPIVRCPLVLQKEGDALMSLDNVLTLLLVIFAALSYIDNHNNKKK